MPIPFNVIMHSDMWSYTFCETTKFRITTRLHSSRMPTTRALTVSPSMLCLGGVCSRGCLLLGVSVSGGCLLLGDCLLQGGVCFRGVSASGGIPACTEADTPLWTSFAGGNKLIKNKMLTVHHEDMTDFGRGIWNKMNVTTEFTTIFSGFVPNRLWRHDVITIWYHHRSPINTLFLPKKAGTHLNLDKTTLFLDFYLNFSDLY